MFCSNIVRTINKGIGLFRLNVGLGWGGYSSCSVCSVSNYSTVFQPNRRSLQICGHQNQREKVSLNSLSLVLHGQHSHISGFRFVNTRMASSSTVFTEGDVLKHPNDPLGPEQIVRIYSMRMCPYAQRGRLLLAAKRVQSDLVNIDLNNKPDWFFDLNPYGEVPVVIHNGKHVYESLIVSEYIEEAFKEPRLFSEDPYVKAYERIYYNHWTKKGIPAFYSLLKTGYADPEQSKRLHDHVTVLENFLSKLGKPYFHGDKVGFSDYMIWPWFERMPMLKSICEFDVSKERYPLMNAWVARMWKDEAVQMCKVDINLMTQHYEQYRTGKPDFTIGADKKNVVEESLENLDGMRDPKTRDRIQTN